MVPRIRCGRYVVDRAGCCGAGPPLSRKAGIEGDQPWQPFLDTRVGKCSIATISLRSSQRATARSSSDDSMPAQTTVGLPAARSTCHAARATRMNAREAQDVEGPLRPRTNMKRRAARDGTTPELPEAIQMWRNRTPSRRSWCSGRPVPKGWTGLIDRTGAHRLRACFTDQRPVRRGS